VLVDVTRRCLTSLTFHDFIVVPSVRFIGILLGPNHPREMACLIQKPEIGGLNFCVFPLFTGHSRIEGTEWVGRFLHLHFTYHFYPNKAKQSFSSEE